jgi:hypothetical protein
MFEIVTFINNFPVSPAFATLTDTLPLSLATPLTMTSFLKIFVQLQCYRQLDVHDLNSALVQIETNATYKIDSNSLDTRNEIHFHFLAFFIEEVMRFRQGLFTQSEASTKKKNSRKDKKEKGKSLRSMIEEMEKKEHQEEDSSEQPIAGGLSMAPKDDVQATVFWDFLHELFFNQVNLGLKLRKKFK